MRRLEDAADACSVAQALHYKCVEAIIAFQANPDLKDMHGKPHAQPVRRTRSLYAPRAACTPHAQPVRPTRSLYAARAACTPHAAQPVRRTRSLYAPRAACTPHAQPVRPTRRSLYAPRGAACTPHAQPVRPTRSLYAACADCTPHAQPVRRMRSLYAARAACTPHAQTVRRTRSLYAACAACTPHAQPVRRTRRLYAARAACTPHAQPAPRAACFAVLRCFLIALGFTAIGLSHKVCSGVDVCELVRVLFVSVPRQEGGGLHAAASRSCVPYDARVALLRTMT
jgi:hypothetical protein